MDFTILNWNIGGAKYLELKKNERKEFRKNLNDGLKGLIYKYNPQVISLQEIVRYGNSSQEAMEIIDPIEGYRYYSFPLIDSQRLSSKAKWNKVRRLGNWPYNTFFAQGNAMLFRDDMPHLPVWDLSHSSVHKENIDNRHFIEQVNLESGLYFGERNSEPRAALVAHFIFDSNYYNELAKPLDIFVVNIHLTTLTMEREGIPEIDLEASKIRLSQLDVVFRGIVSRYNVWKQQGFPELGKKRKPTKHETFDRYQPVWILVGDFNFTPESVEYQAIMRMNFVDCIRGFKTKAKGIGEKPSLTLDYVFAGPKFISLNPLIIEDGIGSNYVDFGITVSDHYPLYATVPIVI